MINKISFNNDSYLEYDTTNESIDIIFKLFIHVLKYFTSWVNILQILLVFGLLSEYYYQILLLSIIISINGFILTYIHPKHIYVDIGSIKLNLGGNTFKIIDFFLHHIPLIVILSLSARNKKKYGKMSKSITLPFSLLVIYKIFNNPEKMYNFPNGDFIIIQCIILLMWSFFYNNV
jgi:hypothetical protein